MAAVGSVTDKKEEEIYRDIRRAIFEEYGTGTFYPIGMADKVRMFGGDTKRVGAWIAKAISLGEIELVKQISREYKFREHIVKKLGHDIPINGILGESRFGELPTQPEVEPPIKSPSTTNAQQLAMFDDVHAFVVTVIVAIGGVAGVALARIAEKMKEFKGWDRDFSLSTIIKRMIEDGLLLQIGSIKYPVYQFTGQSAIRFLKWEDADVLRLGLQPWIREVKTKKPLPEDEDESYGTPTLRPALALQESRPDLPEAKPPPATPFKIDKCKPGVGADDVAGGFANDTNLLRWIVSLIFRKVGRDYMHSRELCALVNEEPGWEEKSYKGLGRTLSLVENQTGYIEGTGGPGNRQYRVTDKALTDLFGWTKPEPESPQVADSPEVPASAPPPPPPPAPALVEPFEPVLSIAEPTAVAAPPPPTSPPPEAAPAPTPVADELVQVMTEVRRLSHAVEAQSKEVIDLKERVSELEEVEEAVVERAVQETLAAMRLLPRHLVPIVLELVATRRREEGRKK